MKIIHLILGKARPERMNGVSKVAHNLCLFQTQLGHEVSLWGITPTPDETVPLRNYETRFFRSMGQRFRLDPNLKKALKGLIGSDAVVHVHGGFITAFYLATRILRRAGVDYVYSPHGAYSPGAFQIGYWKKKIYFQLFERAIVKGARALHFLGRKQFDAFEEVLKIDHKVLIPNGQDMKELEYTPTPVERPEGPVFSFCGRLHNIYKALDLLLPAFARYRKEGGTGTLWLIGDGPDRILLEKQAENLQISEHVIFWGSQYGDQKLNLLAHSDAFVHPSHSEGFPTGVLEAAGMGLPCVVTTATNFGAYAEQYDAGIHILDNTPETLNLAFHELELMWDRGELKEMGTRAREMVKTEFNWETIAERLVEVYGGKSEARTENRKQRLYPLG